MVGASGPGSATCPPRQERRPQLHVVASCSATTRSTSPLLTGRVPHDADLVAAARDSTAELVRREAACDVVVSDLLAGADAVHTLNHPGNRVLIELARRVQSHVGAPADAADPGRVLLGGVRAPLEPAVLEALGLDAAPQQHWLVAGRHVPPGEVVAAQSAWYATRPDVVAEGMRRYAGRLPVLGLA